MFTEFYKKDTYFGSQILDVFWKVFLITYTAMISISFTRDLVSHDIGTAIVFSIFKLNFILIGRVIYEILDKYLTFNDDTNERLDNLIKATWKVYEVLKKQKN